MKSMITVLTLAAFAVGCNQESKPGGPGANTTKPNGQPTAPSGAAEENTFTLKTPATAENINQGTEEEVAISISRGDKFDQKVTLTFEPAAGLTVVPNPVDLDVGQSEVKIKVAAAASVAPGPAEIKVNATPTTGKPVSQTFKVDVKESSSDTDTKKTP